MSVKNILYGTENYLSYFVQTCSSKDNLEKKEGYTLHGSFLSEEKAKMKAEELAKELNVPIVRV